MKRTYINEFGQKVTLPFGFHLVEDLVPYVEMMSKLKEPALSPEARKRLKWMDHYWENGNVSLTCRYFGISRKTFYKWHDRFNPNDLSTLEERDRRPKRVRQREITPLQKLRVVEIRKKHIRYGKEKIARIYAREYGEKISSWKVQKVIEEKNLYYNPNKTAKIRAKRQKAIKKKRITELKKRPKTGFLLCIDTIVIYANGVKRYIFTAIDHYSKLAFARMYSAKSSRNARDFLLRLNFLWEADIENLTRDNGSEFLGEFLKEAEKLQIEDYFSRLKTPTDNPVNERFNRTLEEEFLDLGNFTTDTEDFNKNLTDWLVEYNFRRPHQALGYETPVEMACGKEELLPMYSSSTEP